MARRAGCDSVYDATQRWVDAALRKDDSLFTPGHPIWSLHNLTDFHQRFVVPTSAPGSGFFDKLEALLLGAPRQTIQLAAEILYVHYLIAAPPAISGRNKRERLSLVLSWGDPDISDSEPPGRRFWIAVSYFLDLPLAPAKPAHISLIAEFVLHWKSSLTIESEALSNPCEI